jgi:hypothetical protein
MDRDRVLHRVGARDAGGSRHPGTGVQSGTGSLRAALGLVVATLLASCAGHATPAPAGPSLASASTAPSLTIDPQNPQDLRGASMTITGTVHTRPGCVVLAAGAARWALIGPLATALHDGATATVRGRPAAVPVGCTADHALEVLQSG